MIPVLFPANAIHFATNGLGRLSDVVSCVVTESEDEFFLELEYPITGRHFEDLKLRNLIYAFSSEKQHRQAFRISKISKPLNGIVTVFAYHVSYDLTKIPVMAFALTNASVTDVFEEITDIIDDDNQLDCPFVFRSDITERNHFGISAPASVRAIIGGGEGSIRSVYGGEIEWDNYTVRILEQRGVDNDVVISYGKNLTALTATEDGYNRYAAVMPYYIGKNDDDEDIIVYAKTPTRPSAIVSLDGEETYGEAIPLDLSDKWDYIPDAGDLIDAAEEWLEANQPQNVIKELSVSFIPLWQTEEYKDYAPLQKVNLYDIVTVKHEKLGVNEKLKVVRTEYDVLKERYNTIELGKIEDNIADRITETTKSVKGVDFALHQIVDGRYSGGTFINGETIYGPKIYSGELHIGPVGDTPQQPDEDKTYNINLDSDGNASFAGDVMIGGDNHVKGFFKVLNEDGDVVGAFGRAQGEAQDSDTEGVAIVATQAITDLDNLDNEYDNFVIITEGGVRLQASGFDIHVTELGAFYPHAGYTGSNAEIATWGDLSDIWAEIADLWDAVTPAPEPEPEPGE